MSSAMRRPSPWFESGCRAPSRDPSQGPGSACAIPGLASKPPAARITERAAIRDHLAAMSRHQVRPRHCVCGPAVLRGTRREWSMPAFWQGLGECRNQARPAAPRLHREAAPELEVAVDLEGLAPIDRREPDAFALHPEQRRKAPIDQQLRQFGVGAVVGHAPHVIQKVACAVRPKSVRAFSSSESSGISLARSSTPS